MFKCNAGVVSIAIMISSVPVILWSQNAAPAVQETAPTTSVAPASVEITPNTLDVHVGEKVKFSAAAKDAAGNAIDEKPSVWFAAPFDLAGADDSGEVTFHMPGVVTVGAVIAGKAGYATVNVQNTKIASLEIAKDPK
jgi:plastocyanin